MFLKSKLYQFGKYTWSQIDYLVSVEGYIPVANGTELHALRNAVTQTMGVGSRWENTYTTGLDKKYIQVNHIDFDYDRSLPPDTGFLPMSSFSGIYDGNNLNINGIFSFRPTTVGVSIFGVLTGKVKNLILNDALFIGKIGCASIAYYLRGSNAEIDNVIVVNSTIRSGNVSSNDVGGLVSRIEGGGIIRNSYIINSDVYLLNYSTNTRVGGLVAYCGWTSLGYILNCGVINCKITGRESGGMVGYTRFSGTRIRNSFVLNSEVSSYGTNTSGGFIEYNGVLTSGSQLINNYSNASVEGDSGFCVSNGGIITNCYYDTETSGQSDTGKGLPRTTAQMLNGTASSYINPDGSIDDTENPDNAMFTTWDDDIWNFRTNLKYPKIRKI